MPLPNLERPIFTTNLPSTNQEIKFVPFTVKEEKILLIAESSQDTKGMAEGIKQILSNCILTEIDVSSLPTFDMEYLFIQLRSKSIGNIVIWQIQDFEDDKIYTLEMDLDTVTVNTPEGHTNIIRLDSENYLKLKYPTVDLLDSLLSFNQDDPTESDKLIVKCIDVIFTDEKVFDISDQTSEQLLEFVEGFSLQAKKEIEKFFATIPSLRHTIVYKNSLDHERKYVLDGLRDFFL